MATSKVYSTTWLEYTGEGGFLPEGVSSFELSTVRSAPLVSRRYTSLDCESGQGVSKACQRGLYSEVRTHIRGDLLNTNICTR